MVALKLKPFFFLLLILLFLPAPAYAATTTGPGTVIYTVTNLIIRLGIILFAARLGNTLVSRIRIPGVIGELLAGIAIGPYLLGGIPLPLFPQGLFPLYQSSFPVAPELYGFASLASVLLLFISGLETDLALFLRFSLAGSMVGIGGVVFSFIAGEATGMYLLNAPFMDSRCLFLGIVGTATSVGITARLLSEQNRIDSPEGVTIMAGAIIDDVLGIILLSVVIGISVVQGDADRPVVAWLYVAMVAGKAIGIWIAFFTLGLVFARRIGGLLKLAGSIHSFSILAFGLALLLAGIFEKAGLAMIIGAYIMGVTLSRTDINFVIKDTVQPLYVFFIPIFFTTMGMLVNVQSFLSADILVFGLIFTAGAIAAKVLGCGIPALFLNFNRLGALRVGLGMVPRGEVALIIAGVGLSHGILNDRIFSVTILMTLLTTIIAPLLLNLLLKLRQSGIREEMTSADLVETLFPLPFPAISDLLLQKILDYFKNEGFFIHMLELDHPAYQMRKDTMFISLYTGPETFQFRTLRDDVSFIKTIVYEALLDLHAVVNKLKDLAKPESLRKEVAAGTGRTAMDLSQVVDPGCITLDIRETDKEGIITRLIDILDQNHKLQNRPQCLQAVLERENTMSTGMQHGIALPHGKTPGVSSMAVAVGIKKDGVDFQSIDGEPSTIFVLVISPENTTGPHIRFLASISAVLNDEDTRRQLLNCITPEQVYRILLQANR